MTQEIFKFNFCGVFDRDGALKLGEAIQEAVRKGALHVEVDLSGVELALAGGLHLFAFTFLRRWDEGLTSFSLTIHRIPSSLAIQFQLSGLSVHRHTFQVDFPGGLHQESRAGRGEGTPSVVVCHSCDTPVRVRGNGLYECPSCGEHFYLDPAGRITRYEPLSRLRSGEGQEELS